MNTWNGFPNRYWEKVLATVRASLNRLVRDSGVNNAPSEAIDTRGISYNRAAMEALLEEPEVDQLEVTSINIPIPTASASEVYFDAENGVDGGRNQEEVLEDPEEEVFEVEEIGEGEMEGSEEESEGEEEESGGEVVDDDEEQEEEEDGEQ
jgi:hypothetical protein